MPHRIEAAGAAGLAALGRMQVADGSFPLFQWPRPRRGMARFLQRLRGQGRPDAVTMTRPASPVFSTACILMGAGSLLPRPVIERAAQYLLGQRRSDGLWVYDPAIAGIPPDSDDSACALAALVRSGVELDTAADAARLRAFWRPTEQRFATWTAGGVWAIVERDDPVVNCNVLFALQCLGHPATDLERLGVERFVAQCHAGSRFYASAHTLTHAVRRAGLSFDVLPAVARTPPSPADWFGVIQWLGGGGAVEPWMVEALLQAQGADGAWPVAAWATGVGPRTPIWGSSAVSTALALEALGTDDPETVAAS